MELQETCLAQKKATLCVGVGVWWCLCNERKLDTQPWCRFKILSSKDFMYLNFKTSILYLQVYKQFVIRNFRGWNSTLLHDRGAVKINIVWVWWFRHHPSHQVTQHVVLRSEHNFLFRINAPIFPKKIHEIKKNIYQKICCQFGLT